MLCVPVLPCHLVGPLLSFSLLAPGRALAAQVVSLSSLASLSLSLSLSAASCTLPSPPVFLLLPLFPFSPSSVSLFLFPSPLSFLHPSSLLSLPDGLSWAAVALVFLFPLSRARARALPLLLRSGSSSFPGCPGRLSPAPLSPTALLPSLPLPPPSLSVPPTPLFPPLSSLPGVYMALLRTQQHCVCVRARVRTRAS